MEIRIYIPRVIHIDPIDLDQVREALYSIILRKTIIAGNTLGIFTDRFSISMFTYADRNEYRDEFKIFIEPLIDHIAITCAAPAKCSVGLYKGGYHKQILYINDIDIENSIRESMAEMSFLTLRYKILRDPVDLARVREIHREMIESTPAI